jgi:AraC-like DNA-binding protein
MPAIRFWTPSQSNSGYIDAMNLMLPIEPALCRLPDILAGGVPPADDRVMLHDHCGRGTPARSMVVFTRNALAVVSRGSKQLIDGGQGVQLTAGDVVLYAPGNVLSTSIADAEVGYRSLILFFSDATLRAFMTRHGIASTGASTDAAFRNLGTVAPVGHLVETMLGEIDAGRRPSPGVAALQLELALLMLVEECGPQVLSLFQRRVVSRAARRLQQVMETHWHRNLALSDLAFLCGMSLSTFKRMFDAQYGQSPGRWLQERRLKHAGHLLVVERRRASEVYEMVGYANHSVFSQSFKKHFGLSPREFQASAD